MSQRLTSKLIPGVVCFLALAVSGCGAGVETEDGADPSATAEEADGEPGAAMEGMAADGHDHDHDIVPPEELPGEPFAADVLGSNVYGINFAPDGSAALFVKVGDDMVTEHIYRTRATDDGWATPEPTTFSGQWPDKEPYFAPDGDRVLFASKRPFDEGGGAREDFDIWMVPRSGDGWGEPTPVSAVNSPANEDYPAITADGTLFFVRESERGNRDVWVAAPTADGWSEPRHLEGPLNTSYPEADLWVEPDGRYLILTSVRVHEDAMGAGDLWISFREGDGWSELASLGTAVNSAEHEYAPALSPDGSTFYFARGLMPTILSVPVADIEVLGPGS